MQEDDVQRIVHDYDLTVVDFEPIEGGVANSSYLLRTRHDHYVLTIFEQTWPSVIRLGRLLLLLAEHEFPTSHLILPTRGGLATMHEGKPVLLKTYIPGQVCQDLDETMLSQVGVAMSRLHQVPVPDFLPDGHQYNRKTLPNVIGRNVDPEYESWLAERRAYFEQRILPGLPRGVIHGDAFWDNVLFEGQRLSAIIDFEAACFYYKVFDLGMGIVGLCTKETAVALDKARALVTGYQQARMLEEREKKTLQLFVEYAAVTTSSWRFWKYHIDTPIAAKADKHWQMVHLAKEVNAIPEARFLVLVFDKE